MTTFQSNDKQRSQTAGQSLFHIKSKYEKILVWLFSRLYFVVCWTMVLLIGAKTDLTWGYLGLIALICAIIGLPLATIILLSAHVEARIRGIYQRSIVNYTLEHFWLISLFTILLPFGVGLLLRPLIGLMSGLAPTGEAMLRWVLVDGRALYIALPLGCVLYRLRCVRPFLYGLFEVAVGIAASWAASKAQQESLLLGVIALSSGIYVIVRGLDNMDRGLPIWARPAWRSVFSKN